MNDTSPELSSSCLDPVYVPATGRTKEKRKEKDDITTSAVNTHVVSLTPLFLFLVPSSLLVASSRHQISTMEESGRLLIEMTCQGTIIDQSNVLCRFCGTIVRLNENVPFEAFNWITHTKTCGPVKPVPIVQYSSISSAVSSCGRTQQLVDDSCEGDPVVLSVADQTDNFRGDTADNRFTSCLYSQVRSQIDIENSYLIYSTF